MNEERRKHKQGTRGQSNATVQLTEMNIIFDYQMQSR